MKQREHFILDFVRRNPGATGLEIYDALEHKWRSESRLAKWLGDSFLAELIAPKLGSMYVILLRLEDKQAIRSEWGKPTPQRRGYRPRHYWIAT